MRLLDARYIKKKMSKTLILIPSRLSATRLPGKPLLEINGIPMILHVVNKALSTKIGRVIVATEDKEIFDVVKESGNEVLMTGSHHKTGTDRIYEALTKLKLNETEYIINLQGDEPLVNPEDIINLNHLVVKSNCELGTMASKLKKKEDIENQNIVKVTTEKELTKNNLIKANNFVRKIDITNQINFYHHIGIYQFKVSTLKQFVMLPQSINEKKNNLEQLRALDNEINIDVVLAGSNFKGVDTEEDYLDMKKIMEYNKI